MIQFILAISATETMQAQGISAAGASHEMLKYTAALDAEFIYHGKTKSLEELPVSPSGIVSPALISKACLELIGAEIEIIDLGAMVKPQCPYTNYREEPSACISTGKALEIKEAERLFQVGLNHPINSDELIIAECIVAGTTTAQGLLTALGYQVEGMLSSSIPEGNHDLKQKLVREGLNKLDCLTRLANKPLEAVAAMGDTSQAFIAGLAINADRQGITTKLAGGTQMLAIKCLIDKLAQTKNITINPSPWVTNDKSAQFHKLHQLVCHETTIETGSPAIEDCPEALKTKVQELSNNKLELKTIFNTYAQGHVKEGVGIGALLKTCQALCQTV